MTQENNHSRRLHALLAPSAASRWMKCPGSVSLGIDIPDPEPSEAALESSCVRASCRKNRQDKFSS